MKKFLFALLLPLLSAALFAQQGGEVEKDEDKPVYLGVSFNDILGKATKITDLMLYSDYKILKDENEENVYVAEVDENYSLSFFVDDDEYVRGVAEIKYFDNMIDAIDDAECFLFSEQPMIALSLNGREMFLNAVKSFLKSGNLDLEYKSENTTITYRLYGKSGKYAVTKIYLIDEIIFE